MKNNNFNKTKSEVVSIPTKREPMTMEILNIIHAVLDYKRWIVSDNYVTKNECVNVFDADTKTEYYYYHLPLPEKMKCNHADYKRIVSYESSLGRDILKEMDNVQEKELYNYYWK